MVNETREKVKAIAERIKMERDWPGWKVDEIAEYASVETMEMMEQKLRRLEFNNLNVRAKVNCADQFINIMVAYSTEWDEEYDLDDLAVTIDEWVSDQFWFDKNGDWYDEGRKVK